MSQKLRNIPHYTESFLDREFKTTYQPTKIHGQKGKDINFRSFSETLRINDEKKWIRKYLSWLYIALHDSICELKGDDARKWRDKFNTEIKKVKEIVNIFDNYE